MWGQAIKEKFQYLDLLQLSILLLYFFKLLLHHCFMLLINFLSGMSHYALPQSLQLPKQVCLLL